MHKLAPLAALLLCIAAGPATAPADRQPKELSKLLAPTPAGLAIPSKGQWTTLQKQQFVAWAKKSIEGQAIQVKGAKISSVSQNPDGSISLMASGGPKISIGSLDLFPVFDCTLPAAAAQHVSAAANGDAVAFDAVVRLSEFQAAAFEDGRESYSLRLTVDAQAAVVSKPKPIKPRR